MSSNSFLEDFCLRSDPILTSVGNMRRTRRGFRAYWLMMNNVILLPVFELILLVHRYCQTDPLPHVRLTFPRCCIISMSLLSLLCRCASYINPPAVFQSHRENCTYSFRFSFFAQNDVICALLSSHVVSSHMPNRSLLFGSPLQSPLLRLKYLSL